MENLIAERSLLVDAVDFILHNAIYSHKHTHIHIYVVLVLAKQMIISASHGSVKSVNLNINNGIFIFTQRDKLLGFIFTNNLECHEKLFWIKITRISLHILDPLQYFLFLVLFCAPFAHVTLYKWTPKRVQVSRK